MPQLFQGFALVLAISSAIIAAFGTPLAPRTTCRKTKVAILGAGTAGIIAAQALSNSSVADFVIIEYNSEIGGRCRHTEFGKDPNGNPYTVELGANWIQGTVSEGGPENPIWTLAKKYNIQHTFSNSSLVDTFTQQGRKDYLTKQEEFEDAYTVVEQDSGVILTENLQDRAFRAGLSLANYKPIRDPEAMAWEWYEMDFEYAQTPDVSSQEFSIVNYNLTYYGFSEVNQLVYDQRGFNVFLHGETATFLKPNDSRLILNTTVTEVKWGKSGVTIENADGTCIEADYAICTFSVGVLQSNEVKFTPSFPRWKQVAIETFQMGIYTKIFFQFPPDKIFWDQTMQYLLYAHPSRGYYPIFQPLDIPDFLPGSGIFFATVVTDESRVVEAQSDELTKSQILAVLREMFGADNVPEPIDFMYPRWGRLPWAYGSYSNWPPGLTLEGHQNLRANTDRLWFAGEATSQEYYGFLHGAYFEGRRAGEKIAACVQGRGDKDECCVDTADSGGEKGQKHYEVLKGTTNEEEYGAVNGWYVTSFQTVGWEGGGG